MGPTYQQCLPPLAPLFIATSPLLPSSSQPPAAAATTMHIKSSDDIPILFRLFHRPDRWSAMCIAAWAWQCHPTHRLLLRDEYHSRCGPSHLAPRLHFCLLCPDASISLISQGTRKNGPARRSQRSGGRAGKDDKKILGGSDELGGGTWMGCTRDGTLAFLTNMREPNSLIRAKTRGQLLGGQVVDLQKKNVREGC